ncbi:hypothetical protein GCM10010448_70030 [Streptomyces glomeratus]|uniref:Uncharacterized protein n=1 Tax=Streptomyces glomeratus TaxID=284452 RepID=A0ABP6M5B2_9ACTN
MLVAAWADVFAVSGPAATAAAMTMATGLVAGRLIARFGVRKADIEAGFLSRYRAVPPWAPQPCAFWRPVRTRSIPH